MPEESMQQLIDELNQKYPNGVPYYGTAENSIAAATGGAAGPSTSAWGEQVLNKVYGTDASSIAPNNTTWQTVTQAISSAAATNPATAALASAASAGQSAGNTATGANSTSWVGKIWTDALSTLSAPFENFGFAIFGALIILAAVFAWRPARETIVDAGKAAVAA